MINALRRVPGGDRGSFPGSWASRLINSPTRNRELPKTYEVAGTNVATETFMRSQNRTKTSRSSSTSLLATAIGGLVLWSAIAVPIANADDWPSFRGRAASGVAEGQHLPNSWDIETGDGIRWQVEVAGLAHSSPVVHGNRIFVTSAISSDGNADFKPGLYGDGDASEDRSIQRFMVYAFDLASGELIWETVAHEGVPIDKRHIKSTYANSSPAVDDRVVVAFFGSEGVFAFDHDGKSLWHAEVGRLDVGAYDLRSYEWGPASSPILWNGMAIVQCDSHGDSFIVAYDAATGEIRWRTERDEIPSWGTPTVVESVDPPELVTNGSNWIRGYNARTGEELWRLGGSSKITAPTPVYAEGRVIIASGRAPERPIFAVVPGSRGDLTLSEENGSSESVAWSWVRRGSYMPTPLIYHRRVYVLDNNGVFASYDLEDGREIYRERMAHGGLGFSASPVAADGKIYVSGEGGEIFVVKAGDTFEVVAEMDMGEPLMASPAIVDGTLLIRGRDHLFAIGK